MISAFAIDPIEKKPLYHWNPATNIHSIGFYGCTFKCHFCQNHHISQNPPPENSIALSPKDLVLFLKEKKATQVAFTYAEPLLYADYLHKTLPLLQENNIKIVLVTNGFINPEIFDALSPFIDAMNIDLKSWNNAFYKKYINGKREPVLEIIKKAYAKKIHLEITSLLIEGHNDSNDEISQISNFIASVSPSIPLHLNAYHPVYKMQVPATSEKVLKRAADIAKEKLQFVYQGNIGALQHTYCPECKEKVIIRSNYHTKIEGLNQSGNCDQCNTKIVTIV